jgi:hypothetical protein
MLLRLTTFEENRMCPSEMPRLTIGTQLRSAIAAALLIPAMVQFCQGAPLTIHNPSFEAPVFTDGNYHFLIAPAAQGTYGWFISDGAFIYNPTALDYATAGGDGTPSGADGSQISGIFQFGDYAIYQPLAGADGVLGNGDDPVLMPNTTYSLTVAVGQRHVENQFRVTYGGYDIQLIAGTLGIGTTIIGRETDAVVPPPGTFVDRTIVVDTATLDPGLYGQPLTVLLRKTIINQTANTDFDNARLDAVALPGDYNNDNVVDADDYPVWRDNLGAAIALPNEVATPGRVTPEDYDAWKANFGTMAGAGSGDSPTATVPEPVSCVILMVGLFVVATGRTSTLRNTRPKEAAKQAAKG